MTYDWKYSNYETRTASASVPNVFTVCLAGHRVVTLPPLRNLVEGVKYRVELKFNYAGNTFEAYLYVIGER